MLVKSWEAIKNLHNSAILQKIALFLKEIEAKYSAFDTDLKVEFSHSQFCLSYMTGAKKETIW